MPESELFKATIGGLGLTGLITWAELQLRRVPGAAIRVQALPLHSLEEFFALSEESDKTFEYTVAWIDLLSKRGRGIFYRGDHAEGPVQPPRHPAGVPVSLPLVNPLTVRAFNPAYYAAQRLKTGARVQDYDPFFFPLDAVRAWNRLYGKSGFLQFQCVVPTPEAIHELLKQRAPSPITVLKRFGDVPSPGLLSFPRKGFTLALDLPNAGADTFALFERMERITMEAGGALYPAKDARMSPQTFQRSFPRVQEFAHHVDPAFSSSFWRRVFPK
jgi:FAD/FMN-containing dehydrogenase